MTLFTFGDVILDCARLNPYGVHPGQLLVHNDDKLFPQFRGLDLGAREPAALVHRAVDGATVDGLPAQMANLKVPPEECAAIITIGGNDLLCGLAADTGADLKRFAAALDAAVRTLRLRPLPLPLRNVFDPTFGDDSRNFLGVDARIARANHRRVNEFIAQVALRYGALVDLHTHFLRGAPHWFTNTIEPSLIGASEVRGAFLQQL